MFDDREIGLFLDIRASESGWSRHTRAAYRRDLHLYCRFLETLGKQGVSETSADEILDFVEFRRKNGDSDRTLNRRLAAIRSWYGYLLEEGVVKVNVASDLPTPRRSVDLPHYLTRQEMEALLRAPEGNQPLVLRDLAAMELLYACGIRASELTGLRQADFHQSADNRWALKVLGKGNKERFVPLHDKARERIDAWLHHGRPHLLGPESSDHVFLSRSGRPMTRNTLYRRLGYWGKRADIRQNVTPHLLRHTFATHLVHEGADLRAVQEMMGHASLATTTIYTSVDAERLKSIHKEFHPRG